jgi:hypothetical protein
MCCCSITMNKSQPFSFYYRPVGFLCVFKVSFFYNDFPEILYNQLHLYRHRNRFLKTIQGPVLKSDPKGKPLTCVCPKRQIIRMSIELGRIGFAELEL